MAPRRRIPSGRTLKKVNEEISKLNGKDNVTYLDIGDKFLDKDGNLSQEIMPDYLHPHEKGYEIWARGDSADA